MSHTIAIFPGSFDPFTRGHQALVDDALRIFDKVVIGIGNNVSKAGLLRIEARKQLIEDLYADNPRVEVRIYTGLTATSPATSMPRPSSAACATPPISNTNGRWRRPTTACIPTSSP